MWLLREKLDELEVKVSLPPQHVNKDFAINIFPLIKKQNKTPEEAKNLVLKKIGDIIESHELVGGYLNINLDWNKVLTRWKELFEFPKRNKKILIEHTSANPNKALHIGHLRNSILGDALVRLFKTLNYEVEVLNYIDDTGSQVADVIVGFYFLNFPENPLDFNDETLLNSIAKSLRDLNINPNLEEIKKIIDDRKNLLKTLYGYEIPKKFDHYCGDFVYVIVNKLYNLYPELEKLRSQVIKAIERREGEIYEKTKRVVKKVLEAQLETLWTFDIYFDLLNKESDILYFDLWEEAFKILKDKGIVELVREGEKKGTWSIDLENLGIDGIKDKYKVLVRSDGTTVYLAKDIAYALWKHGLIEKDFKYSVFCKQPNGSELWQTDLSGIDNPKGFGKAEVSINVIGSEQSYLQQIISKIINRISNNKVKYVHYGYGLVMLSKETAKMFGIREEKEFVKMSGRKGVFVNVDNLLEKTKKIAYDKLKERYQDLSDAEIKNLAFKIARSTLAYEILKYDRNRVVIFDLDRMTNVEEGNALYLLYTYARIQSLLRKAGIENPENYARGVKDLNNSERNLLRVCFLFKDVLYETERTLELNRLADYALRLCRTFNEFYQSNPIIPELESKPYRLFLAYLTGKILEKIFYILKIDGIERV